MKPVRTRRAALATSLATSPAVGRLRRRWQRHGRHYARLSISSVKVFGDSIQDSGTFGYKFTVRRPDNLIYAERIAANYSQTLCNFFVFTGTTFAPNSKTGCTNFAIGGGRITYTGAGGAANPLNIGTSDGDLCLDGVACGL